MKLTKFLSFATVLLLPALVRADCQAGVLVPGCVNNYDFKGYLVAFLTAQMPLLLFIAVLMVVASGVQYMLSGFTPDGAKKAKERISGILLGVIFLLLIRLLINNISPSISLDSATATSAPSSSP